MLTVKYKKITLMVTTSFTGHVTLVGTHQKQTAQSINADSQQDRADPK